MRIYKILRAAEWQQFQRDGRTHGAPVDLADGFIHFSTATQLDGTLARHFAGEDGLVLLALDGEDLGDALRWEPSRGGQLFPHLYRALDLAEVIESRPVRLGPAGHETGVSE